MAKTNRYVLGGNIEIDSTPKDQDGVFFVPSETRLSIKEPTGTIVTVSGAGLTTASGYLYYVYKPETTGWFQYEVWVKDGTGRERVETNGFEIYDKVF